MQSIFIIVNLISFWLFVFPVNEVSSIHYLWSIFASYLSDFLGEGGCKISFLSISLAKLSAATLLSELP